MVAMLPEGKIDNLIALLQNNHSSSITIGSHQLKDLQQKAIINSNRKQIELPPPEQEDTSHRNNVISLLELEAEALVLELELLAA